MHPGTCQPMVHDGRAQDAGNDRPGLLEARREDERKQLRLVADFGEGDNVGGDKKRFHDWFPGRYENG